MKWLFFILLLIILQWCSNGREEGHFFPLETQVSRLPLHDPQDSLPSVKRGLGRNLSRDSVYQDSTEKTSYPYGFPRGLFQRSVEL